MSWRIPTRTGVLILAGAIGVPLAADWVWAERGRPAAESRRSAVEAESFARLAAARGPAELGEAVGPLGVVLQVPGGAWIAVRYRDSHAAPGWSSAVARDSGGGWFVSREHFCGRFQGHRLRREQGEAGDLGLVAVERAEGLEAARAGLVAMGFQPASPPSQ
jgi:hypothetical protein